MLDVSQPFLHPAMSDSVLPPELLHLIFCHLAPRHLKIALLVSSRWRQVGEAPVLWRHVNLRLTRENIRFLPELLGARRMAAVREVTIEDVEEVEELLLAVSMHQGLSRLNFNGTDLTSVEAELLARLVHGVDRLEVEAAKLTTQQIEAILVALGGPTKLKLLAFYKIDLTAVSPALLARSINRLEGVRFVKKSAKLTNAQSEAILAHLADSDTKLKVIEAPFPTMQHDVVARAINKLEKFYGTLSGPLAEAVLLQSLVKTKLTRAIITISRLSFDENLVKAARKVIPHLDVSKTAVYHRPSEECPNNHPQ